jgi:hypothetical protein
VAYNSTNNEFLVVWEGVDNIPPISGEQEIFGQRVGGATNVPVGDNDFRLSDMGTDGYTDRGAYGPAVAYNSAQNEYLVVWFGDDNTGSLAAEEYEIYGQRVYGDWTTGTEIGGDIRLSDMGPADGNADYDAYNPAVAYNSSDNEYLVVWYGNDSIAPLADELEIYGQRVDGATGAEVGDNDFHLSDMGPDGDCAYWASSPDVAYNSSQNEYLVVWNGEDDVGMAPGEYEIFGQRLNASTGMETGDNDFRLSDMGPPLDPAYHAYSPAAAYRSRLPGNHYLVVWCGDDDRGDLVDEEFEIFGQRFLSPYQVYLPMAFRGFVSP